MNKPLMSVGNLKLSKDILTNNRKWSLYTWQSMGVGIYKQYACVWLGDEQDTEKEPLICQAEMDIFTSDFLSMVERQFLRKQVVSRKGE